MKLKRQNLLNLQKESLNFQLIAPKGDKDLQLDGFLCPFLIHDTYAVDLTLLFNGSISLDQLRQFNPKKRLLPPYIQASLGQTLLLYGELIEPCNEDEVLKLANDCVVQLLGTQNRFELDGDSKLLDNQIYEYETLERDPSKRCRILVWLINPKTPIIENLELVATYLLELLCPYHKILYAYDQAQWCQRQAEEISSFVDKFSQNFLNITSKDRLYEFKNFKELLPDLYKKTLEYSRYIRDLVDHESTITINIRNYESRFNKLCELGKSTNNDLSFFRDFIALTHDKYKSQIQFSRQHLESGSKLIDTVMAMVTIERAELEAAIEAAAKEREEAAQDREKRLGILITLLGTSLAFSSISVELIKPSEKFPFLKLCKSDFVCSFPFDMFFHFIIGFIFAIIVGGFIYLLLKTFPKLKKALIRSLLIKE
ncbi:hypothetical protein [Nostoc sp. ATCC 53789]|uniref:hypothetical protein n=1 Tax=Nostoc sp. ATCC 53789 TaxID=76335 RepID=UPI0011BF4354|nr:hypothetical protein [Nostoc sp. ATCC 53789]QHG18976.1 hypothetical protein GJB62_25430 [Nostoc sp. ATCC 53789]